MRRGTSDRWLREAQRSVLGRALAANDLPFTEDAWRVLRALETEPRSAPSQGNAGRGIACVLFTDCIASRLLGTRRYDTSELGALPIDHEVTVMTWVAALRELC